MVLAGVQCEKFDSQLIAMDVA